MKNLYFIFHIKDITALSGLFADAFEVIRNPVPSRAELTAGAVRPAGARYVADACPGVGRGRSGDFRGVSHCSDTFLLDRRPGRTVV